MSKTVLDLYKEIVIDALAKCDAKLRKSFKTAVIKALILYMVIPGKINFDHHITKSHGFLSHLRYDVRLLKNPDF